MIKEKSMTLLNAWLENNTVPMDIDEKAKTIEKAFDSFINYFNTVASMEYRIAIYQATLEPEEFRIRVMETDKTRTIQHDACIANCNMLNRISEICKLPPFFDKDISDRQAVAQFVGDFSNELYAEGIKDKRVKRTTDDVVKHIDNKIVKDMVSEGLSEKIMDLLKSGADNKDFPDGFSIKKETFYSVEKYTLYYEGKGVDATELCSYYPDTNDFQMKNNYNSLEDCIKDIKNDSFGTKSNEEPIIDNSEIAH